MNITSSHGQMNYSSEKYYTMISPCQKNFLDYLPSKARQDEVNIVFEWSDRFCSNTSKAIFAWYIQHANLLSDHVRKSNCFHLTTRATSSPNMNMPIDLWAQSG
jgi:hypothetical protein